VELVLCPPTLAGGALGPTRKQKELTIFIEILKARNGKKIGNNY